MERAVSKGIPIIPLRIEDVPPSKSLEYFLSAPHWLDALTPPLEKHLRFLAETVSLLLSRHGARCDSREGEKRVPAKSSPDIPGRKPSSRRKWLIGYGVGVAVLLLGVGATLMMRNGPSKDKGPPVAQNTPPDNTKASPPDNTRPPRPAAEAAETRLVANVKEVAGMDLVRIPAGEFYMGSEKGDADAFDDEKPRHKVRISGPFWLGKYKVTVGQFKRFVGASDYVTEAEKDKDKWTWRKPPFLDSSFDQTDEHPVVCVSWNDAKAYCAWVAEKTAPKSACRVRPRGSIVVAPGQQRRTG